jgi:broad specificity phosphatase PhoE
MLYLVRHGRATAGVEELDPGLDPVGRSQAVHVADALRGSKAIRLVCSPLARARQTAAPIAQALGLEPEIVTEIAEIFAPSQSADRRRALIGPLLSGRWSQQPQPLRDFRDRVLSKLTELGSGPGPVIVVSHFVAISAAIGASTEDDRVAPCALTNASITTMDVQRGRLVLKRPGQVAHLPPDEITATQSALPGRP